MSSRDYRDRKREDSNDHKNRRERSRDKDQRQVKQTKSRSRSQERDRDRKDKKSRWSDGPTPNSRFSTGPTNQTPEIQMQNSMQMMNNANSYPSKPTAAYNQNAIGSAVNPNIIFTLADQSKVKKKVYIPKVPGVNFVGLLIGPRGTYQKRLEQQSGCKILIRGK